MCTQDRATALHEAGHAVALEERGVRVTSVVVNPHGAGEAIFPPGAFAALSDDDAVLVGLAGIQAESLAADANTRQAAVNAYLAARGDRGAIADLDHVGIDDLRELRPQHRQLADLDTHEAQVRREQESALQLLENGVGIACPDDEDEVPTARPA